MNTFKNEGITYQIFFIRKLKYINMKKLMPIIFAGMIGGVITLGGFFLINPQMSVNQPAQNLAQLVSQRLNVKPDQIAVPFDFTNAAALAMPVVVHISAAESQLKAKQRQQQQQQDDPFSFFFGNDPFLNSPYGGFQPLQGTGSGVIISSDGYIVTNNHVIEYADEVEVTLFDNKTYKAKIIGTDKGTDLAVLKIEAENLPVLEYANSDGAKVGEWVLAVGNPFDLTSTVTAGIISAKGRDINIIQGSSTIESFIQTDAAVNPGNSGGALVDAEGKLLGINTAIMSRTGAYQGYSFAIPISMVSKITKDIIEYGSFQRAYLGLDISQVDNELAEEMNLNISQGVLVENTVDGGAAQYAGILPKDIIVKVDNKTINTVPELQEVIGSSKVGEDLDIVVYRNGNLKTIPVRLKAYN